MKSILVILVLLCTTGFFVSDAYAYVDPGTGSLFIQAVIGAIIGFSIALKIYWYKLKERFFGIKKKNDWCFKFM